MHLIPIDTVIVPPDRQRSNFDESSLVELAESITRNALINALTVREDGVTLVAGERRLRAIQTCIYPLGRSFNYAGQPVPPGMVPVVSVSELDPLSLEEVELDENIKRRDLTWQEVAAAQSRLHHLRVRQAAVAGATHTVLDTAIELGKPTGPGRVSVSQNLALAQHLDDSEVAKAKTPKDAMKLLLHRERQEQYRELGALAGAAWAAEIYPAGVPVIHGDCLEWLRAECAKPAGRRYDVILTDPPYSMGADTFGDSAGRLANIDHTYSDDYATWTTLMREWAPLSFAIAKPQAHAYVFCDLDRFHELKGLMAGAGWYVFRTPLVNVKTNSGRVPLPDEGPRRQYELCLYAIKGHRKTTAIYPDVIQTEGDPQLGHGAQKPVALFENLLKRSTVPGNWVLDTFAGTGPIIPAAHNQRCFVTAIEHDAASYGMCIERLHKIGAPDETV